MPGRQRIRRGRSRSPTSAVSWRQFAVTLALAAGANQVVSDLTPPPMRADLTGTATIVRSLMSFNHMLGSVNAVPSRVGVGITIMTNDAFFALAPPDPAGDESQGWYYWTEREQLHELVGDNGSNLAWEADVRSSRRLRGGFKLVLVVETIAGAHIDASELHISMRNVWKVD